METFCQASFETRQYGGGVEVQRLLYRGTPEQIAEQIARAIKNQLDHGRANRIELTPIPPYSIVNLSKEGGL